jgi:predicted MFS family arabinose efflux permease
LPLAGGANLYCFQEEMMEKRAGAYKTVFGNNVLRAYFLLLLAGGAAISNMNSYLSVWLVDTYKLGTDTVSILVMISGIVGILVNPLFGLLSDRFKLHKVITCGFYVMYLIIFLMMAGTVSFPVTVVLIALSGIGLMGPVLSSADIYIMNTGKCGEIDATVTLPIIRQAWSMGFIFGPMLGSLAILWMQRTGSAFYVSAIMIAFGIIIGLSVWRNLDLSCNTGRKPVFAGFIGKKSILASGGLYSLVLLIILVAFTMIWCPAQTRTTFLPLLMTKVLGYPKESVGLMITTFSLAQVLTLSVAGRLVKRIGTIRVLFASACVGIAYSLLQSICKNYILLAFLQLILGIAAGLWNTSTLVYMNEMFDNRHGFASGMYVAVGQAPPLLVGIVMGPVSTTYGIPSAFVAASILCLTGMLIVLAFHFARKRKI